MLATLLLKAPPEQVTALFTRKNGAILAATGNPGKLFQLGPGLEKEGTYESEPFDTEGFSDWGRLQFRAIQSGDTIDFATRSGNLDRPQRNWSPWQGVVAGEDGGPIQSPAARFLQYRATMHASPEGLSPALVWVNVAYQARNVAPIFSEIEITPPNYKFPPRTLSLSPSTNLTLLPLGSSRRAPTPRISTASGSVTLQYQKGSVGLRWLATDDNGDSLRYRLDIRGVKDKEWMLLTDKLDDSQYSWDGLSFPDGEYVVRVTASDAPDNPVDKAKTAEIVSEPFLIDNTPPVLRDLKVSNDGAKVRLEWSAADASSNITKAEYSINGEEWLMAEPVTGISDARELSYKIEFERGKTPEQVIAVRVADEYDNVAVQKKSLQ